MMQRPGPGRKIDWGKRTVPGQYFDLACAVASVSQEEVARRAGVAASTLSRGFSGQTRVDRDKLLSWGDILLELCPDEDKELLLLMEEEMLHTLGVSTRDEKQQGVEKLPYFQQKVSEILTKRRQAKSSS